MAGVLRRLGAALGLDPDVAGARLEAVSPAPVAPASHDAVLPRAIVVLGQWGGTRGLADAFEAFGRATRATFLNRVRGVTACALADPAFACAAGMLFRRIASTPSGLRFAAAPESADLVAELRLEETIAARLAWANLAARGASSSMWEPLQRRAAARPVAPGEGEAADRDATHPATRLRGIMFAVMLEERLLSRFGRAWFTARDAGAMLRDLWAAEPDENVVSMAASLGLGTMDSSPLLEAYRLGKGRVA